MSKIVDTSFMTESLVLNSNQIELINITKRTLGKLKNFDSLRIFENDDFYEVHTKSDKTNCITRTKIGKIHWRVMESFFVKPGEEEQRIK